MNQGDRKEEPRGPGAPIDLERRKEVKLACIGYLREFGQIGELFPSLETINERLTEGGKAKPASKGLWRRMLLSELAEYVGPSRSGGRAIIRSLPKEHVPDANLSNEAPKDMFWATCDTFLSVCIPEEVTKLTMQVNWFDGPKMTRPLWRRVNRIISSYGDKPRKLELKFILQSPRDIDERVRRVAGQVNSFVQRCTNVRDAIASGPIEFDESEAWEPAASDLIDRAIQAHSALLDDYRDLFDLAGLAHQVFHKSAHELREGKITSNRRPVKNAGPEALATFEVGAFSGFDSFPSLMIESQNKEGIKIMALMGMYPTGISGAQSPILSTEIENRALRHQIVDTINANFENSWSQTVPVYCLNDTFRRENWTDPEESLPYFVTWFGSRFIRYDKALEDELRSVCVERARNFTSGTV